MNTYKPVPIAGSKWAIEHTLDGVAQGLLSTVYVGKSDAAYAVYQLARREWARDHPVNDNIKAA